MMNIRNPYIYKELKHQIQTMKPVMKAVAKYYFSTTTNQAVSLEDFTKELIEICAAKHSHEDFQIEDLLDWNIEKEQIAKSLKQKFTDEFYKISETKRREYLEKYLQHININSSDIEDVLSYVKVWDID